MSPRRVIQTLEDRAAGGGAGAPDRRPGIEVRGLTRRFGRTVALDDVALEAPAGEIHALLGPNGAGKSTLLRILTGLVQPQAGEVRVLGLTMDERGWRDHRRLIGFVPSGDRSFYLRLSGYENLLFFGRLQGLGRAEAAERARQALRDVDLAAVARRRVGFYSHGMQKRLSVARGLLASPAVLLVDEATHDLDPAAAERVQQLVANAVADGAAAIWATQRLEEIRGFAHRVTLLDGGRVRFAGTVPQLVAQARPQRHVLRLRGEGLDDGRLLEVGVAALGSLGILDQAAGEDREHFLLRLGDDVSLGDALAALVSASIQVLACREERSELGEAFLQLVGSGRR